MSEARIRHLPYVIQRTADGKYRVLNRQYKPLGFPNKLVQYEDYPIAVKFKGLGATTAAKISYKGSTDLEAIYLYNDGWVPTRSAANMNAYLRRLAVFAKLKIVDE